LRNVARVLGEPRTADGFLAGLKSGQNPRAVAEEMLYDLCESDVNCRAVMQKHGATRATLKELYWMLMLGGAGQRIGEHFAPAAAIAYAGPLDYLLTNRSATDAPTLALEVIQMIEQGRLEG